jgi:hypothetical protein
MVSPHPPEKFSEYEFLHGLPLHTFFKHRAYPTHRLFSTLTKVFTLLLMQKKKNSTNLLYRVRLQVFVYKYHKDFGLMINPDLRAQKPLIKPNLLLAQLRERLTSIELNKRRDPPTFRTAIF